MSFFLHARKGERSDGCWNFQKSRKGTFGTKISAAAVAETNTVKHLIDPYL